jgi:hypothetical protein
MDKRETAMIVARVADIDRRTLSDTIVETWHEIIGHLDYEVARRALTLVARESPETIKPAHLVRAAGAARAEIERERRRADRQRAVDAQGRGERVRAISADIESDAAWYREMNGLGE